MQGRLDQATDAETIQNYPVKRKLKTIPLTLGSGGEVGAKDMAVVKGTDCFHRGPSFSPPEATVETQPVLLPIPQNLGHLWPPLAPGT